MCDQFAEIFIWAVQAYCTSLGRLNGFGRLPSGIEEVVQVIGRPHLWVLHDQVAMSEANIALDVVIKRPCSSCNRLSEDALAGRQRRLQCVNLHGAELPNRLKTLENIRISARYGLCLSAAWHQG